MSLAPVTYLADLAATLTATPAVAWAAATLTTRYIDRRRNRRQTWQHELDAINLWLDAIRKAR